MTRKIERVDIDAIEVGARLRVTGPAAVTALAESIRRLGQLQPISLYAPDNSAAHLVTGHHRLEAAKRLGWTTIEAVFVTGDEIDRELHEIAENLHRAELSALDRDIQLARWIELNNRSEVLRQPDAKPPKSGRPEGGTRAAAREIGVSEADARRAVKVASIAPEAKQAAKDAGLDDNRSVLLAVSKESTPEAQVEKINSMGATTRLAKHRLEVAARAGETRKFAAWIIARSKPGDIAKIAAWLKYSKPDEVLAAIREMQSGAAAK